MVKIAAPTTSTVTEFETAIASFFNAPYAVATDSCTHALELCLRYTNAQAIYVPERTYLSVPMLADKLGIQLCWIDHPWQDYYNLTLNIIDAAVLWERNSYIPGMFMCVSFQYQKHLSLGRGGMILCDRIEHHYCLKKMSYDGRLPGIPWREQDIEMMGYHYYMTPETAQLGLDKLTEAKRTTPRKWVYTDWPDLTKMKLWKNT